MHSSIYLHHQENVEYELYYRDLSECCSDNVLSTIIIGLVDLELELKGRLVNISVTPAHATIIWHFQEKCKNEDRQVVYLFTTTSTHTIKCTV